MSIKRVCTTSTQLYITDSRLVEFKSRVQRQWKDSGQNLLVLVETAFYPTSGGQPHDTGTIDGVEVVDVFERDGEVTHVLDGEIASEAEVSGRISWARRHDHMQQHTGQHILSQALVQFCDIQTVGFTIGPDWCTIVLDAKPDAESLDSALQLANSVVDEDRRIDVLFPSAAELSELPVRGIPPDKESIRIVRIDRFDWSPCGGTHCESTGDVRLIVPLNIRKDKDGYRLEFVCGRRAEQIALRHARTISEVATLLDVSAEEIVDRTRSTLSRLRSREETIEELREARLMSDLERLSAAIGDKEGRVAKEILDDRSVHELRRLARMLVEGPGVLVLLVGRDSGKLGIAFARSEDRTEDMNEIMRLTCSRTGCRGGGNAAFATGGGGADVDAREVLAAATLALERET